MTPVERALTVLFALWQLALFIGLVVAFSAAAIVLDAAVHARPA